MSPASSSLSAITHADIRYNQAVNFYLPPAGREIIKRISCVCSCVIECVSRFYKELYITLVVSPWPFQCFL